MKEKQEIALGLRWKYIFSFPWLALSSHSILHLS
jgi:hypothetical protein